MVGLSVTSVALKWNIFFVLSCLNTVVEYSPVYLKHLGFSPSQVGLTSLFGVTSFFLPLLGLLGDKFRARRLFLVIFILAVILLALLPLLPLGVNGLYKCRQSSSEYLGSDREQLRNQTCCPKQDSFNKSRRMFHSETSIKRSLNVPLETSGSSNFSLSVANSERTRINPNATKSKHENVSSPSFYLILFMVSIRGLFDMFSGSVLSSWNVAVMTYNKKDRAKYGSFVCWGQIGAAISLFSVGVIASKITWTICGTAGHGYFVAFLWAAASVTMSLVGVPWMKYDYLDRRVIKWTEVKQVLVDLHYIITLFIGLYLGLCYSFQFHWEFWYIAELSGSPMVMAVGGLIRRPLVAIWYRLSVNVIEKLGDLKSLAMALFIYAGSQLALSLIRNPWFVLVIDIFQSAAHVLAFSSVNIHFSKAGSKASSGVMIGLAMQSYNFGVGLGASCTGLLISSTGTKSTLLYYAIATAIIFMFFLSYVFGSKHLDDYEIVRDSESEDDDG